MFLVLIFNISVFLEDYIFVAENVPRFSIIEYLLSQKTDIAGSQAQPRRVELSFGISEKTRLNTYKYVLCIGVLNESSTSAA